MSLANIGGVCNAGLGWSSETVCHRQQVHRLKCSHESHRMYSKARLFALSPQRVSVFRCHSVAQPFVLPIDLFTLWRGAARRGVAWREWIRCRTAFEQKMQRTVRCVAEIVGLPQVAPQRTDRCRLCY